MVNYQLHKAGYIPWNKLCVDLIGPLRHTEKGIGIKYKYKIRYYDIYFNRMVQNNAI